MSTDRTRRDVIKGGAALAAGLAISGPELGRAAEKPASRAVLIRDTRVVSPDGAVVPGVLTEMLDRAVAALVAETDVMAAWKQIVSPDDVVGIKTNGWRSLPTPRPLEEAIRRRVLDVGVAPGDISIVDQSVLRDPVFRRATALINTRPMRTHAWSGLGTCIKNYIMFAERPSDYHGNACETLGAVWQLPAARGKTRLNLLVMLTPQFHSQGPHSFSREHLWPYCGLIASREPATADAVGAAIIQAKRREFFGGDRPISPSPHHIKVAAERYGLGEWRLDAIDLVRLGERSGSLI